MGNRLITDRSGDVGVFANEPPGFDSGTNRILGTGFGYDTRGNLNAQSDNTGMAYDGEGRQMAYCQNTQPCTRQGAVEQYFYDGEGRRVERVGTDGTTVYVYDAGGELAAGGMRYLTADHLGTTRAIADESGKLVECHDYYPFGEEVMFGASDPRAGVACYGTVAYGQPGFTGKARDKETGLDFFNARYVSLAQGRFTSPDPVFASAAHLTDPQMWNEYAYVRNNPLKLTDPTGLDFYTTCTHTKDNGDTCQQVQNGSAKVWVQGTSDSNGNFTANRIASAVTPIDPMTLSAEHPRRFSVHPD